MSIWYCTREDVQAGGDISMATSYIPVIDSAIESASRTVESAPLRRFYPIENQTVTYDWPAVDTSTTDILWFDGIDFISIDSVTVGGVAVSSSDYVLEPANFGPPYTHLKFKDTATTFLSSGSDRVGAISIVGTTGYTAELDVVGVLDGNLTEAGLETAILPSAKVGVGSLLKIGGEYIKIVDRCWAASADQVTQNISKTSSQDTFTVDAFDTYTAGTLIRVGSEKMLVESYDNSSGGLVVKRAVQGSVLAEHAIGATVETLSSFQLQRAVLGTTAAAHAGSATVSVWKPPALIKELVIAEAITTVQQRASGYGRTVGTGDAVIEARGVGLQDLRAKATARHRRAPIYRVL